MGFKVVFKQNIQGFEKCITKKHCEIQWKINIKDSALFLGQISESKLNVLFCFVLF